MSSHSVCRSTDAPREVLAGVRVARRRQAPSLAPTAQTARNLVAPQVTRRDVDHASGGVRRVRPCRTPRLHEQRREPSVGSEFPISHRLTDPLAYRPAYSLILSPPTVAQYC